MSPLSFNHLENLYDELANAIDAVGGERESLFLAKLVLSLAQELGDGPRISELLEDCLNETGVERRAMQRLI
ncbi:MAG: hypothetical protein V4614_05680 [Pseudomonadota bacterium]